MKNKSDGFLPEKRERTYELEGMGDPGLSAKVTDEFVDIAGISRKIAPSKYHGSLCDTTAEVQRLI